MDLDSVKLTFIKYNYPWVNIINGKTFGSRNELLINLKSILTKEEYKQAREEFFSKGQPCFRASPLTKTYGFGVHSDKNGKVAIYGMDTEQYQNFLNDTQIKKIKAMRSTKK